MVGFRWTGWSLAQWIRSTGVLQKLNLLHRLEREDSRAIESFQSAALAQLLVHARTLPFFEARIPRSFPRGATSSEVLAALPLLEKSDIRDHFDQMTDHRVTARIIRTGGSTGEPLQVAQDAAHSEWRTATNLLREGWMGYHFGDAKVRIWGSELDLAQARASSLSRIKAWVRNETLLNCFRMNAGRMEEFVDVLNRRAPSLVHGYAESLYELACFINLHSSAMHSPRAIWSSAGTLHAYMRAEISSAFDAPVFNHYGSREAGAIASECEAHGGLHVSPTHLVEVLDSKGRAVGPGETGEVVVTLLFNYAMPLLRYRIGDLARVSTSPCPCGRSWLSLAQVEGRTTDVLHLPSGGVLVPETLIHLIGVSGNESTILRFQVVQNAVDQILVRLEGVSGAAANHHDAVEARIRSRLRPVLSGMKVNFSWVTEIQPEVSGKRSLTKCSIPGCRIHAIRLPSGL